MMNVNAILPKMSSVGIISIYAACVVLLQHSGLVYSYTCTNDTHFNLTFTSETTIDFNWFHDCVRLTHLNLSHNAITSLQNDSFNILWNVQFLDLSFNNISYIHESSISNMRSLKTLDLSHNEITEIPVNLLYNKENLVTLDLSYNKIIKLSILAFNHSMSSIQTVLLHHNLITAFEPVAYINVNHPIRTLDLRFNNISTFSNDHNWIYNSRSVYKEASTDLRNNSISTWHDWYIMQYKDRNATDYSLETVMVELLVDIRDNPFPCDCTIHNLVERIRQSFFRWSNSAYLNVRCHNPPELRGKRTFYDVTLKELVCNVTEGCPAGCLCQDRPELGTLNVDCRGLNLTSMPDSVPRSPYGKIELQLDDNSISVINNVTYFPYITKLSMANNQLTNVPEFVIDEIASKENAIVDFSNNSLTDLPAGLQNIKFQNTKLNGNSFECKCGNLWMVDWISLAPIYADKSLECMFENKLYEIVSISEDLLKCNDVGSVILIVVLTAVLFIVVALLITAKRCPYETKVLLFKIFRIHPSDNYLVDKNMETSYDMYVSFDDNDIYVTKWVMKVLFKQLEDKKPFYKLSAYGRNGPTGAEAEARLQLIDESRRLLIVLSRDYDRSRWCEYEVAHSETLEQNEGRIIYLLYDNDAHEMAKKEPWMSRMHGRKVFSSTDKRWLWAKLRYELPRKPLPQKPPMQREDQHDMVNIQI